MEDELLNEEYSNHLEYKLTIAPKYGSKFFNEYGKKLGNKLVGLNLDSMLSVVETIENVFGVSEENKDKFITNYKLDNNNMLYADMCFKDENKLLSVNLSISGSYTLKVYKNPDDEEHKSVESRFRKVFEKNKNMDYVGAYNICKYNLLIDFKSNDYKEIISNIKELSSYFLENFTANEFPKIIKLK